MKIENLTTEVSVKQYAAGAYKDVKENVTIKQELFTISTSAIFQFLSRTDSCLIMMHHSVLS